jgi:hypothetical protein
MLKALRAGLGFRVATAIAVFAALSLTAPPAVMAFGHGEATTHCLANADVADHGMHKAPAPKQHGDHGKLPGTSAPGCCGLYCLSALPLAFGPTVEGLAPAPALSPQLETLLPSGIAARLDRPPISSLSV